MQRIDDLVRSFRPFFFLLLIPTADSCTVGIRAGLHVHAGCDNVSRHYRQCLSRGVYRQERTIVAKDVQQKEEIKPKI